MREGDTLWSIAAKTTGDPLRYQEIFELIPAAAEEESWAEGMGRSGALLHPVAPLDPHQGTDSGTAENEAAAAGDFAAEDTTGDAAQFSSARVVPIRPISPAAAAQLASVLAADPDLDADLAEWASETVLRPTRHRAWSR